MRAQSGDAEETLVEALWALARQLRHGSVESLAPLGVTPSQSRALRVLARFGVMRLSELSGHLRIAPRSATEVVDDLQSRGLVERRDDPADRRATLVAMTPQGVEVIDAVRTARTAEAERVFERLTATERATLARILRKLRD